MVRRREASQHCFVAEALAVTDLIVTPVKLWDHAREGLCMEHGSVDKLKVISPANVTLRYIFEVRYRDRRPSSRHCSQFNVLSGRFFCFVTSSRSWQQR